MKTAPCLPVKACKKVRRVEAGGRGDPDHVVGRVQAPELALRTHVVVRTDQALVSEVGLDIRLSGKKKPDVR